MATLNEWKKVDSKNNKKFELATRNKRKRLPVSYKDSMLPEQYVNVEWFKKADWADWDLWEKGGTINF